MFWVNMAIILTIASIFVYGVVSVATKIENKANNRY